MIRRNFFRSCFTLFVTGVVMCSISGCGELRYWSYEGIRPLPPIENPWQGLSSVGIAPVEFMQSNERNMERTMDTSQDPTPALRQALLQVAGIQQVTLLPDFAKSPEELAGKLPELPGDTQAFLRVRISEFSPYYPPSATIEVEFFISRLVQQSSDDVMDLEQMGSAPRRILPGSAGRDSSTSPWLRFQKVYRSDDPDTAERLEIYASGSSDGDRGMGGEDRIVRISDRFLAFVLYETVRDTFAKINSRNPEENDGNLRELTARTAQ